MRARFPSSSAMLAMAVLLWACGSPTESGPAATPTTRYEVPEQTSDGWRTASAESTGMALERLEALLARVDGTFNHRIHSLLIVRHGRLVLEEYWPGWDLAPGTRDPIHREFDRETLHYVASVSKSITSMLAGIAIEEGAIGSVDDALFSFFPDYAELTDAAKAGVTLRTMLAFSSGLYWNEFEFGFDHPQDSHNQMFGAEDPIRYLLGREMVGQPGAAFLYNSGDTNLVGEIVRRATSSETLMDFLDQRLFGPLGINWWLGRSGCLRVPPVGSGRGLHPRWFLRGDAPGCQRPHSGLRLAGDYGLRFRGCSRAMHACLHLRPIQHAAGGNGPLQTWPGTSPGRLTPWSGPKA